MVVDQTRAEQIAELIRDYTLEADRDALVCAIISRFPDVTGAEIQEGIDLATLRKQEIIHADLG